MKFINFAVVKLAVCLAGGIVIATIFPITSFPLFKCLVVCVSLLFLVWFLERRKLQQGILFGLLTYMTIFIFGYGSYQLRDPAHQNRHYSHFYTENNASLIQLKIREVLKPNRRHHKYFAELFKLNSKKVHGKILVTILKDSTSSAFKVDYLLLISSEIEEVAGPSNPYQFDYKKYLKNLGVFHQVRISEKQILQRSKGPTSLRGFSENIRNHIIHKLSETPIEKEQRVIIQALILGQRKDISKEMYGEYIAAGALHILAVSGLHVGILFLILSWLFKPLEYLKFGKQAKSVLLLLFLWGFAILAGLSPSVVRAVTMFSFFGLAGMLDRPTNSFNTLFLSFFTLLVFNPNWLYHVGFQLSYLAVFFILWIQPELYKSYIPKFYLDKLLWGIITVTLAAQIGIAPLSLYYFHQFPGLFFITNLVILPFLAIILAGGLLVIILTIIGQLPNSLALGYNWLIKQLNGFVHWIAQQQTFIFTDISFSFSTMIAGYALIFALILWWKLKTNKAFLYVPAVVAILFGVGIWENRSSCKEQLVVFHKSRTTLLGYRNDRVFTLLQNDTINYFNRFPIRDYRVGSQVTRFTSELLPRVFRYRNKTVLLLDSLGVYPSEKIDIILLTNSPKVNLERLIDSIQPTQIIADGSNYRTYVKRWHTTCTKRKIPFHYTGEKGAYIFDR
ncbi:MAG: ComEC/Rec2 family competence protein [Bacteroidetes bacterium]|nr:ComEC/Rec2 family competence protein [Bacteroidota bacterium]